MKRTALVLLAAALLVPGQAQANDSVGVGGHWVAQWGRLAGSGARLGLAYDHAVSPDRILTFGARAGALVGEGGASPFVGARVLLWTAPADAEGPRLWGGLGADLWINTSSSIRDPVFLYTGLDVGARFTLAGAWYLETPLQLGVLPFFNPMAYALSAGVRVGQRF